MTTTTTEHAGASSDEQDQDPSRTAERAWQPAPVQHQWRFMSAVHAARAVNARPA